MSFTEENQKALLAIYSKDVSQENFRTALQVIDKYLNVNWSALTSTVQETQKAQQETKDMIFELLNTAFLEADSVNEKALLKKCELMQKRYESYSLQEFYANTCNLGIREKAIQNTLTPDTLLIDLDLERAINAMGLSHEVQILKLNDETLGTALHFQRKDHMHDAVYRLNFLLNVGGGAHSQGMHWVAATCEVNTDNRTLQFTVVDSLSLSEKQRDYYEHSIQKALSYQSGNYIAYPNFEVTFDVRSTGLQKDSFSCGYHALFNLLEWIQNRSEKAENYFRSEDRVKAFYELQVGDLVIDGKAYQKLNCFEKRYFQLGEKNTSSTVPWYHFNQRSLEKSKEEEPRCVSLPEQMEQSLKTLEKDTQFISFSHCDSLSPEMVYELFSRLSYRLNVFRKQLMQCEMDNVSSDTLDGLSAFLSKHNDLPVKTLCLNVKKSSDTTIFFDKLKRCLIQCSDSGLLTLKLCDVDENFSQNEWEALVLFVEDEDKKIRTNIVLPKNFENGDLQRRIDEAILNQQRIAMLQPSQNEHLSKVRELENRERPKRTRARVEAVNETVSVDIEVQQEVFSETFSSHTLTQKKLTKRDGPTSILSEVNLGLTHLMNSSTVPLSHSARIISYPDLEECWRLWMHNNHNVTGMTTEAFEFLLLHQDAFQFGLNFESELFLPRGFFLVPHPEKSCEKVLHFSEEVDDQEKHQTVAYLTEERPSYRLSRKVCFSILEKWEDKKVAELLKARLMLLPYDKVWDALIQAHLVVLLSFDEEKLKLLLNSDVTEVAYFLQNKRKLQTVQLNDPIITLVLDENLKTLKDHLKFLFNDIKKTAKTICLHGLDKEISELIACLVRDWNFQDKHYVGLFEIFSNYGKDGLLSFQTLLNFDKDISEFLLKTIFQDEYAWSSIVCDLNIKEAYKILKGFKQNKSKYDFFSFLLEQHAKYNTKTNLYNLLLNFQAFSKEIEAHNLMFPEKQDICLFEKPIKNMPTALGRILTLLKSVRTEDVAAQWDVMFALPLDEQGALDMMQINQFHFVLPVFFTDETNLSPLVLARKKYYEAASRLEIPRRFLLETYQMIEEKIVLFDVTEYVAADLYTIFTNLVTSAHVTNDAEMEKVIEYFFDALQKIPNLLGMGKKIQAEVISILATLKHFPPCFIFTKLIDLLLTILKETGTLKLPKKAKELKEKLQTLNGLLDYCGAALYEGMRFYVEDDYVSQKEIQPLLFRHIDIVHTIAYNTQFLDDNLKKALISVVSHFGLHHLSPYELKSFFCYLGDRPHSEIIVNLLDILKNMRLKPEAANIHLLKSLIELTESYAKFNPEAGYSLAPYTAETDCKEKVIYYVVNEENKDTTFYINDGETVLKHIENGFFKPDDNSPEEEQLKKIVLNRFQRKILCLPMTRLYIQENYSEYFSDDFFLKAPATSQTLKKLLQQSFSEKNQEILLAMLKAFGDTFLNDVQAIVLVENISEIIKKIPHDLEASLIQAIANLVQKDYVTCDNLQEIINILLASDIWYVRQFLFFLEKLEAFKKTSETVQNIGLKTLIWMKQALPFLNQPLFQKEPRFYWKVLDALFESLMKEEDSLENKIVLREKEDQVWNDLITDLTTDVMYIKKESGTEFEVSETLKEKLSLFDEKVLDKQRPSCEALSRSFQTFEATYTAVKVAQELAALRTTMKKTKPNPYQVGIPETLGLRSLSNSLVSSFNFVKTWFQEKLILVYPTERVMRQKEELWKNKVGSYIFIQNPESLYQITNNALKQIKLKNYEKIKELIKGEKLFKLDEFSIKTCIDNQKMPKKTEDEEKLIIQKIEVLQALKMGLRERQHYLNVFQDLILLIYKASQDKPQIKEILFDWMKHCFEKKDLAEAWLDAKLFIEEWVDVATPETTYAICQHFSEKTGDFSYEGLRRFLTSEVYCSLQAVQKEAALRYFVQFLNNRIPVTVEIYQKLLARFDILAICCEAPPYPAPETILTWIENENSLEDIQLLNLGFKKSPGVREELNQFKIDDAWSKILKIKEKATGESAEFLDGNLLSSLDDAINKARTLSIEALLNEIKAKDRPFYCLIANAAELLHRVCGKAHNSFELNTTQYLSLLCLLSNQKVTAGIGTGEGKSRIMMVLAACQYASGLTVDFVTSDMQLASRDYLAYQSYFKALGAKVSLINANSPFDAYGDINFSDASSLQLFRNRAVVDGAMYVELCCEPEKRSLLLDEADDLRFDSSDVRYNYSMEANEALCDIPWVYEYLVTFFLEDFENKAALYHDDVDQCREDFIAFVNAEQLEHGKTLLQFSEKQIETWQESAWIALSLKLNQDFVLNQNKLIFSASKGPMQVSAAHKLFKGREAPNVSLSFGVHQCLAARLNILKKRSKLGRSEDRALIEMIQDFPYDFYVENEKQIVYSSSSKSLENYYHKGSIKAVTGTPGETLEADETKMLYDSTIFYIPRHQGLQRTDHPPRLLADDNAQLLAVIDAIQKARAKNQPILLLAKDDEASQKWKKALENHFKDDGNLKQINGQTLPEEEAEHIQLYAGKPGMITISTPIMGRGCDIQLQEEAKQFGLNVLMTFLPEKRALEQMRGRAGRFGQKGETHLFLSKTQLKRALKKDSLNDGFYTAPESYLENAQRLEEKKKQKHRLIISSIDVWREEIATKFFKACASIPEPKKRLFLSKWADFIKETDAISRRFLTNLEEKEAVFSSQLFSEFSNTITQAWQLLEKETQLIKTQEGLVKFSLKKPKDFVLSDKYQTFLVEDSQQSVQLHIATYQHYHKEHDGKAVLYTRPFEQLRALIRGERKLFANFRAWRRGEGILFPNLRAFLNGHMRFSEWLMGGSEDENFRVVYEEPIVSTYEQMENVLGGSFQKISEETLKKDQQDTKKDKLEDTEASVSEAEVEPEDVFYEGLHIFK